MSACEELHAMIKAWVGDDPPELIASKVNVKPAVARRWRARRGFAPPSRATLERVFDAYAVSIREQQIAQQLWFSAVQEVYRAA
jgi:hypothetical protein